ncbi:AAA family ATPase [Acidianus manzaensis]|uniref:ATPase n=1 Tax=Acidianus manzaensis TaxID=282676 RepID=A0A1W6JYC2_9CREN|nr:ATP-binding protein [Acidianus manzaensis]ARM75245.1 ATPase [Acidianus manzaensis]
MYFDFRPKETRNDLFDREEELKELHSSLSFPIILLTGIRRIGKTSVLKVFLNELNEPYALIDVRSPLNSYEALYSTFSAVLSQINRKGKISEVLKHYSGISLVGLNISLSWNKDKSSLQQVFDKIDESGKVVIAFDEAQNLRGKLGSEFLSLLSHCYDYCKNVTFILTGSEIGLLYDFLKIDDPSSSLFGRHVKEIRLERFDDKKSKEFLEKGFSQINLSPPDEIIDYAVENLDGMVGWLTEFGYMCYEKREANKEFVDEILKLAQKMISEELSHFSKEYITVIEAIAKGLSKWNEIKDYMEKKRKRVIYDAEIGRYLENLQKRGYVVKTGKGNYEIVDPVIKKAFA